MTKLKKKSKRFNREQIKKELKNKLLQSNKFIPSLKEFDSARKLSWFDIESYEYDEGSNQRANAKRNEISNELIRSIQIKIMFTNEQMKVINEWIELARIIYNITVKYFRKNKLCGFIRVRPLIKQLFTSSLLKRIKESNIPVHVIDNTIHDVCKAYKSSKALIKSGHCKYFMIRYKKLNKPRQTIVIESQDFSKTSNSFYVKTLKEMNSSTPFNELNIKRACRLTYYKNNNMYILNVPNDTLYMKDEYKYDVCSIDPGNCSFLTIYNPSGECEKICNRHPKHKLVKLVNRKLQLKKHDTRRDIHKALLKNNRKITNYVKDLHYQSANYLTNNYKTIYLGRLSTKSIVQTNLSPFEKQYTYALSHFKFSTILQNHCNESNKTLIMCDEAYTSQTCGRCGENVKVKRNRIFNCPYCQTIIDRDFNGARNILIKSE